MLSCFVAYKVVDHAGHHTDSMLALQYGHWWLQVHEHGCSLMQTIYMQEGLPQPQSLEMMILPQTLMLLVAPSMTSLLARWSPNTGTECRSGLHAGNALQTLLISSIRREPLRHCLKKNTFYQPAWFDWQDRELRLR